jgi:hypothetical protein
MSNHWTDRLSEYLDGDLDERERAALEAHLEGCAECAAVLEELGVVVSEARGLPDLPPERDLWPEIEGRLQPREQVPAAPADVPVIPLAGRRRVAMTIPQLIAAGIALVLFSAGGVWMSLTGVGPADPAGVVGVGSDQGTVPVAPVSFTATYEDAIAELQVEYLARRTTLDPETIRVVERNLEIIDQAIQEARRALEDDPSSGFLNEHLAEAMRRKVDLLRQAAKIETTQI